MYIPAINAFTDRAAIIGFMQRFSFATVVTAKDGVPVATHLPFVISTHNDAVMLTAHFAKANPQWADIEHNPVLVIFSEPHAYISPASYENKQNVPTWNYVSVHGTGKLLTEKSAVLDVLRRTIDTYEAAYGQQWDELPESYRSKMMNAIVAFEITVNDLQAKKKLSQNRTAKEKQAIIGSLSKSNDTNERLIADFIRSEQP